MKRFIFAITNACLTVAVTANAGLSHPPSGGGSGGGSQPPHISPLPRTDGSGFKPDVFKTDVFKTDKIKTDKLKTDKFKIDKVATDFKLGTSAGDKKFFNVAKLGDNGHLKLSWSCHKPRHHHHHDHLHWCDCDCIDLCDWVIGDRGVCILELKDGTALDEGMNKGDVIVSINGKATPNIDTLRDVLQNAGDVADVMYINGETGETEVISLYPQDGKLGIVGQDVPVK